MYLYIESLSRRACLRELDVQDFGFTRVDLEASGLKGPQNISKHQFQVVARTGQE